MKKSHLFFYMSTLVLLTQCCSKSPQEEGDLMTIKLSELTNVDATQFEELFDEIHIVPLETLDHSLFADVRQTICHGTNIYVRGTYSSQSGHAGIWQFDNKGNFIKQLGDVGEGPGEYRTISNIVLKNDTLFAFDSVNRNVHLYQGSSGEYLSSTKTDGYTPLQSVNTVIGIPGASEFLFSSNVMFGNDTYELGKGDPLNGKFEVILPQKFKVSSYISYVYTSPSLSSRNSHEALAILPLNDTIYSVNYKSGTLKPYAVLELEHPMPTFSDGEEYDTALAQAQQNNFNQPRKFYSTEDYLIVNRISGSLVWNTNSKKGWQTLNGFDARQPGFPFYPVSVVETSKNNTLVCAIKADSFKNYFEPKLADCPVKINRIDCSDITPESNDVLVIYKLKK